MSAQNPRVFPVTWTTGASLSNQIDLGGGYLYIALEIPGSVNAIFSTTASPYYIQVANSSAGTFRRYMEPLTSTVANDFSIASAVSNRVVGIPYMGNRYVKIEMSGTVTTPTAGFNIIATDSL